MQGELTVTVFQWSVFIIALALLPAAMNTVSAVFGAAFALLKGVLIIGFFVLLVWGTTSGLESVYRTTNGSLFDTALVGCAGLGTLAILILPLRMMSKEKHRFSEGRQKLVGAGMLGLLMGIPSLFVAVSSADMGFLPFALIELVGGTVLMMIGLTPDRPPQGPSQRYRLR